MIAGEQHIHVFHSVYAYYSRFFLTMECRNGKFFQKSHQNEKVDAFLERKEENQAERVWKARQLPWKWDSEMHWSQSSLTVTVQRKRAFDTCPTHHALSRRDQRKPMG